MPNGNLVSMGVEYNIDRFPVAYHVLADERDLEFLIHAETGKRYLRVPSDEIIHVFLHDGVWQTRGVPWIHPALMRFNQLGKYEEAELVSARGGASKMGFITDADDGTGYTGDDDEDTADDEQLIEEFEPGMIGRLKQGQTFTGFNPDHPNAQYGAFVKTNLRGIAAALGESYNQFAQDLEGVSFGSLRQGALSERAVWMGLQEWLIEEAFDRIFAAWLQQGLIAGAITTRNGRPLPFERIEKFLEHEWQPRRWEWIDPLKDTSADSLQQKDLTMSRSERIRKRGRQPTEVFTEIATENALMDALGIASAEVDATLGDESVGDRLLMLETEVADITEDK
jgi:lambda family phage portal protein